MPHGHRHSGLKIPLIILLLLPLPALSATTLSALPPVTIGVLAKRGPAIARHKWTATAHYLATKIPADTFTIVPLDFDALYEAVRQEKIDFFITNSSFYVELESRFKVSRIATLENRIDDRASSLFGGVIFTSINRNDLKSIADLKGHSFMAVNPRSLGGWQMAWRELKKTGIDPRKDFSELRFGGTHDAVVHAVLSGKVEAGTVRTDTLERMLAAGTIARNDFRIINPQPQNEHFPYYRSTPLYPEWPFAKLQHTPNKLTKQVAQALLQMNPDSEAAIDAKIAGWNVPLDYLAIHDLMRELQIGPYRRTGKVSLANLIVDRWREGLAILSLFALLLTALFGALAFNRRIKKVHISLESELRRRQTAEAELLEHRQHLESLVQQRTKELEHANRLSKKTHERLEEAQRVAHLGCWEWQIADDTLWWSSEIYNIFGRTPAQFGASLQSFLEYVHPADRELVQQAVDETLSHGRECDIAHRIILPNGEQRFVHEKAQIQYDDTGAPIRMIGTVQDITSTKQTEDEKKELESQLQHLQKIEAIGTLAGGIAHDFNNLLTPILGYAELAEETVADNPAARRQIAEVIRAGHHASALVRQILTFSRRASGSEIFFHPDILLKESLKLLRSSIPSTIEMREEINNACGLTHADPTKFQQVIINICTNALHAMKNEKGILTVSLDCKHLTGNELPPNQNLAPGEFIEIIIGDTGCGMDETTLQRIFEPYFTTKEHGRGTGLGLAIVHGIIQEMRGTVMVASKIGQGTTFTILIPTTTKKQSPEEPPTIPSQLPRGNEHILIIDDEEPVLRTEKLMLETLGYRVTAKNNSLAALAEFKRNPADFDLIFTDQTMPDLTGTDLAARILAIRPKIPIILCTGYSSMVTADSAKAMGIKSFLMKPVSRQTMAETVRSLLDKGHPS